MAVTAVFILVSSAALVVLAMLGVPMPWGILVALAIVAGTVYLVNDVRHGRM